MFVLNGKESKNYYRELHFKTSGGHGKTLRQKLH